MNEPMLFRCSKCGFEHARIEQRPDGVLRLIVTPPYLQLIIVDKAAGKAFLKCPKCDNDDPVDLELFTRF